MQRSAIAIVKTHLHLAITNHIASPFTLFQITLFVYQRVPEAAQVFRTSIIQRIK